MAPIERMILPRAVDIWLPRDRSLDPLVKRLITVIMDTPGAY